MTMIGVDGNLSNLAKAVKGHAVFQKNSRNDRLDMQAIFGHLVRRNKKKAKDDGQQDESV